MTITTSAISKVQAKIKPLIGRKAWGVSLGIGSFITLEFGAKIIDPRAKNWIYGEWHLWITYCAWRLETKHRVIASSEDDRSELQEAVQRLENHSLLSVEFTPPSWETTFTFEKGLVLRLFPIYTTECDHWRLRTPDDNVLVIGPGTHWSYRSVHLPPAS